MVRHISEDPVGVTLLSRGNSEALRVARVGSIGGTNAFAAVDHAEDSARFKEDRVSRARRGDEVDTGGAVTAGVAEDRGTDLGFGFCVLRVAGGRERGRGEACCNKS